MALHLLLGDIFATNWNCHEKSLSKTNNRKYAKVSELLLQLLTMTVDITIHTFPLFRLVYKWFLFIYKLSYGLGIFGYIVMMMTFCGINLIFSTTPQTWMDVALLFIFYGLYYGVLGRDLSELSTDKMSCHIGYYNIDGMPTKSLPKDLCGLCAHKLFVSENDVGVIEDTYKLTCDHVFHE